MVDQLYGLVCKLCIILFMKIKFENLGLCFNLKYGDLSTKEYDY